MKLLQNLINRIFTHWQNSLVGVLILFFTFEVWQKNITSAEWITIVGTILGIWRVFVSKDPDKTENKPGAKP